MTRAREPRRGMAAIWALVVVAVVSAMTLAAAARMAGARKRVDGDRNRAQAEWLARAGYELAVGRLLAAPDGYPGETATPVAGGEVKIVVRTDPDGKGVYRIECEARFPAAAHGVVSRLDRAVRRSDGSDGVRITPVRPPPPGG
jgi:type II secretory pathway pseudopilin PulG